MPAPSATITFIYDGDVEGAADALLAVLRRPEPERTEEADDTAPDASERAV